MKLYLIDERGFCFRIVLFCMLWLAFFLVFFRFGRLRFLRELLLITKNGMEDAARQRLLMSRSMLAAADEKEGFVFFIERQLNYSGLKRRMPFLTAEGFLLFLIVGGSVAFGIGTIFGNLFSSLALVGAFFLTVTVCIMVCKTVQMRATNDNLLKLLDFLGNYSLTSGDIVSVFGQVAKYMEEPIRGALEECCVEAQTTGDIGMALLSMADRIEHPRFRELVRNIEVSLRYSADFSVLVSFSRRSLREYQRSARERKSLLYEAAINMLLLLGMSLFALLIVDGLLDSSIWYVLLETLPGHLALGAVGIIFLLFGMQVYKLET